MSRIERLRILAATLLDFFFPDTYIARLTPSEFLLQTRSALWHTPLPDGIPHGSVIAFAYRHKLVRRTILELKYRGSLHAAALLGQVLADALSSELEEVALFDAQALPALLVPIPLGKKRLRKRGWNQAELLADAVARTLGNAVEIAPSMLMRTRDTKSQTALSRTERFENVRDAFAVVDPNVLVGRTVIVLDDVITTGATITEAHRALLMAGAARVICAAIAH